MWSHRYAPGPLTPCTGCLPQPWLLMKANGGSAYFESDGPRPYSVINWRDRTIHRFFSEREALIYLYRIERDA